MSFILGENDSKAAKYVLAIYMSETRFIFSFIKMDCIYYPTYYMIYT